MFNLLASNFHGAILGESIVVLILLIAVIAIYVIQNRKSAEQPAEESAEEPAEEVEEPVEEVKEEVAPVEQSEPVEQSAPVEKDETAVTDEVPTVASVVGGDEENDEDEEDEGNDWAGDVFFSKKGEASIVLNRSFAAKLSQSKDETKLWYSDLKNCLLSYKDVKARRSWKRESFYIKNRCIAKMSIRGKTLCLYFAVKPDKYNDTKYKVEDVSETKIYAITPCMYRMKNARRAKYATQIIAEMLATLTQKIEGREPVDYRPATETCEELIQKGLIKVIEKK